MDVENFIYNKGQHPSVGHQPRSQLCLPASQILNETKQIPLSPGFGIRNWQIIDKLFGACWLAKTNASWIQWRGNEVLSAQQTAEKSIYIWLMDNVSGPAEQWNPEYRTPNRVALSRIEPHARNNAKRQPSSISTNEVSTAYDLYS